MGQSLPPGATEREVKMWTEDILGHLEAAGVGTCGTDLYWGQLPDSPKSCGAVIPYPGLSPEEQFGSEGAWLERPRAQFSWRAGAPDRVAEAFTKAQEAFDALAGVQMRTIGSTLFYRIQALQSPFVLYQGEDGLVVVGFNFATEFLR